MLLVGQLRVFADWPTARIFADWPTARICGLAKLRLFCVPIGRILLKMPVDGLRLLIDQLRLVGDSWSSTIVHGMANFVRLPVDPLWLFSDWSTFFRDVDWSTSLFFR